MTLEEALGDCNYEQECGAIFADPTTIVNDCGCDFDPNCPRCFPFNYVAAALAAAFYNLAMQSIA
ncbi:hypothetical protein STSR3_33 [Salmonella virus STSR3]|nr:hypothetical protein STSR3_33 [Salmonella virus STSR3]